MTLKETITRELLDAVGDPGGLEGVFRRHSHSKGPLYAALAEATAQLYQWLEQARKELTKTEVRRQELQGQIDALSSQRRELDQRVEAQEQRLSQVEARLAKVQGLLEEAHGLTKLDFSAGQLARLRELLLEVTVSQGVGAKQANEFFFQKVGRYQDVASLEVDARKAEVAGQKAKAEAARWQAEAKCKARKASIDLTEKLLVQGVKEPALPHWARILAKAGVAPESLARVLEQYATLDALVHARQKRADELKDEVAALQGQVKALAQERREVHSAIQTVKQVALTEVQKAGQGLEASLKELEARVQEFGSLKEQLGDLRAEAALARALRSGTPDLWQMVDPAGHLDSPGCHAILGAG